MSSAPHRNSAAAPVFGVSEDWRCRAGLGAAGIDARKLASGQAVARRPVEGHTRVSSRSPARRHDSQRVGACACVRWARSRHQLNSPVPRPKRRPTRRLLVGIAQISSDEKIELGVGTAQIRRELGVVTAQIRRDLAENSPKISSTNWVGRGAERVRRPRPTPFHTLRAAVTLVARPFCGVRTSFE